MKTPQYHPAREGRCPERKTYRYAIDEEYLTEIKTAMHAKLEAQKEK